MTRHAPAALVPGILLLVAGCLTVDSKLDAKGGGSMTLSYVSKPEALEAERKKAEGPNVKVVSAEQKGDRAALKLTFDDVRKLDTSRLFDRVSVTLADAAGGDKELTVKVANKDPRKLPDDLIEKIGKEVRIALELPGAVVTSNAQSTQGNTVTWVFPTVDWLAASENTLKATYKGQPAAK
jgi:hypothetical protein